MKQEVLALVDADSIIFASCAVAAKDPNAKPEHAFKIAKQTLNRIKNDSDCDHMLVAMAAPDQEKTFRHNINKKYKANRKKNVTPPFLDETREYVMRQFNCHPIEANIETDDFIGIFNYSIDPESTTTQVVMVHIDKDLNMLAGHHWNYRNDPGSQYYYVTEQEALITYAMQVFKGDTSDNIPSFYSFTKKRFSAGRKNLIRKHLLAAFKKNPENVTREKVDELLLEAWKAWGGDEIDFNFVKEQIWILRE
jgi:5'-3' exonuclease